MKGTVVAHPIATGARGELETRADTGHRGIVGPCDIGENLVRSEET